IQLLRITVVIQCQDQITSRLAHHPIARSNRADPWLVCNQHYLGKFVGYHLKRSIGTSIGCHKHLIWSRPELHNCLARPLQIGSTIPRRDHHGHSHKTACAKSTASGARSWSGQKLFDGERVLGRLNPPVAIRPHQFTRCRSFTPTQMKILEIDHGGLDISVEEPIQHVIIHIFSVNLKNLNMLDYMSLSVEHSDLHNWISPWCLDRRRENPRSKRFPSISGHRYSRVIL